MPYTPPAARSPTASRPTTPKYEPVQEQLPQSHTLRQDLPHSASSRAYLSKHRRSPSISDPNTIGPLGSSVRGPRSAEGNDSDSEEGQGKNSKSKSSHKPRLGPVESSTASTSSPSGSPPHSSSEDEANKKRGRVRDVANLAELQAAIRIIEQHRSGSPNGQAREDTKKARMTLKLPEPWPEMSDVEGRDSGLNHRRPLSNVARKITHSRSSTDTSAFFDLPRNKFDSPAHSSMPVSDEGDDEDDDEELTLKPSLIRKKSGELVRPALRAPSMRRRPSSMPGTPTYSKAVHFQDSSLEHVRHFLQVDRPIAVSAGASPVESSHEDDVEFPFPPPFEWEMRLTNFPRDPLQSLRIPVRLERVYLSSDTRTLIGAIAVRNLAFHKLVVARFTLDYWKTTSEVVAEYNSDVRKKLAHDGYDRFTFSIKLEDQGNLENKTMFFCVRYNVNGQDFWDNNNNLNYQINFSKKFKHDSQSKGLRPPNALPRSKPTPTFSNASPSMRPRSMPSFDDFASNMVPCEISASPHPAAMIDDSPIRFRSKPLATDILPDAPGKPKPSSNQPAFGARYDFGASLSATMQGKAATVREKNEPPVKSVAKAVPDVSEAKPQATSTARQNVGSADVPKPEAPLGPRPAALTAEKPSMQSPTYEQLLNEYCFVRTRPGTVQKVPVG